MFAALARGVPQAGLAFAVAMMLGIAMTLWGVALATVLARESIARLVQHAGASIARVSRALDAMSALLLLAVAA